MRLMPTALGALAAFAAQASPVDPLARYIGASRVVIASAPQADDPALARQRALFAQMGRAAASRDLVLVKVVGAGAQALRARLGLNHHAFSAALVGKDGEVKLRSARPLDAATLFPLIDSMPMRRAERRERGE